MTSTVIHFLVCFGKVFGIPDERLGEVVCAAIKITEGSLLNEEKVKKYCNGNVSFEKKLASRIDYLIKNVFFAKTDREI